MTKAKSKTTTYKYKRTPEIKRFKAKSIETEEPEQVDTTGMKFPPPERKSSSFKKRWKLFIDSIVGRENFGSGHLGQLEIICDLYCEYEQIVRFLEKNGHTFVSIGRNGKMVKPYPQTAMLSRIRVEIRNYSKMLGLTLKKESTGTAEGEEDEWE